MASEKDDLKHNWHDTSDMTNEMNGGSNVPSMKELEQSIDILTEFIEKFYNNQKHSSKQGYDSNECLINISELLDGIVLNPTVFHSLCQCIDFVYESSSNSNGQESKKSKIKDVLYSKLFALIDKKRYDFGLDSNELNDLGTNFSTLRCLQFRTKITVFFCFFHPCTDWFLFYFSFWFCFVLGNLLYSTKRDHVLNRLWGEIPTISLPHAFCGMFLFFVFCLVVTRETGLFCLFLFLLSLESANGMTPKLMDGFVREFKVLNGENVIARILYSLISGECVDSDNKCDHSNLRTQTPLCPNEDTNDDANDLDALLEAETEDNEIWDLDFATFNDPLYGNSEAILVESLQSEMDDTDGNENEIGESKEGEMDSIGVWYKNKVLNNKTGLQMDENSISMELVTLVSKKKV